MCKSGSHNGQASTGCKLSCYYEWHHRHTDLIHCTFHGRCKFRPPGSLAKTIKKLNHNSRTYMCKLDSCICSARTYHRCCCHYELDRICTHQKQNRMFRTRCTFLREYNLTCDVSKTILKKKKKIGGDTCARGVVISI